MSLLQMFLLVVMFLTLCVRISYRDKVPGIERIALALKTLGVIVMFARVAAGKEYDWPITTILTGITLHSIFLARTILPCDHWLYLPSPFGLKWSERKP